MTTKLPQTTPIVHYPTLGLKIPKRNSQTFTTTVISPTSCLFSPSVNSISDIDQFSFLKNFHNNKNKESSPTSTYTCRLINSTTSTSVTPIYDIDGKNDKSYQLPNVPKINIKLTQNNNFIKNHNKNESISTLTSLTSVSLFSPSERKELEIYLFYIYHNTNHKYNVQYTKIKKI